jgi:hypothetical protein
MKSRNFLFMSLACICLFLASAGTAASQAVLFSPETVSCQGNDVVTVTTSSFSMLDVAAILVNGESIPHFVPDSPEVLRFITPGGEPGRCATVTIITDSAAYQFRDVYMWTSQTPALRLSEAYPRVLPTNDDDPNEYLLLMGGFFANDLTVQVGGIPQEVVSTGALGAKVRIAGVTRPGVYDLALSTHGVNRTLPGYLTIEEGVYGKIYAAWPRNLEMRGVQDIYVLGQGIDPAQHPWDLLSCVRFTCDPDPIPEKVIPLDIVQVLSPKAALIVHPAQEVDTFGYQFNSPLDGVIADHPCGERNEAATSAWATVEVGIVPVPGDPTPPVTELVITPARQDLLDDSGNNVTSWTIETMGGEPIKGLNLHARPYLGVVHPGLWSFLEEIPADSNCCNIHAIVVIGGAEGAFHQEEGDYAPCQGRCIEHCDANCGCPQPECRLLPEN